MIPRINAAALIDASHDGHDDACAAARRGAGDVGFLTVYNTPLSADRVSEVIAAYRAFFHLPASAKETVDMAKTGSNRGWGAPGSEQVDPDANPDYKQVFDCGLPAGGRAALTDLNLPAYAPNVWPEEPPGFAETLRAYFAESTDFALDLLCAIAGAVGEDADSRRWLDTAIRPAG